MRELLQAFPSKLDEIAFFIRVADPGLQVMVQIGMPLTVPNAHDEVASCAHWQSNRGCGTLRETGDLIMKVPGGYNTALTAYLKPTSS